MTPLVLPIEDKLRIEGESHLPKHTVDVFNIAIKDIKQAMGNFLDTTGREVTHIALPITYKIKINSFFTKLGEIRGGYNGVCVDVFFGVHISYSPLLSEIICSSK